ncbi:MAG: site-2 protease family protein [Acidimicrobiia bacterium]|nr:site-2 protease family protein [Acidimicrobiia bacterium]
MTQIDQSPPTGPETPAKQVPAPEAERKEALRELAPVVVVLVSLVTWSVVSGNFAVVGFVLAILAVVMIHEGGHFIAAKRSGMKVTEYFVGFGPRLWSVRRGETEYGVKAIPLGGYVKIIGMSNLERDVDPADEPRTYRQQSYGRRMLVAGAGIITHFVIAILVLAFAWTAIGFPDFDAKTTTIGNISAMADGQSPATKAGFRVGDRIVSYDGIPAREWRDLPPYIRARPDQDITFVVERSGSPVTLTARPAPVTAEDDTTFGYIGIGAQIPEERVNPLVALGRGTTETAELTWRSVAALGSIFSPNSVGNYARMVTGDGSQQVDETEEASRPVSVVGVARIAGQAADRGIVNVLELFVILNVFLAVVNLFPLLPFDGGHMAIATYERIRSRKGRRYQADVTKLMPFAVATVVLMVMLGGVSIWLDIFRPLANPFQ